MGIGRRVKGIIRALWRNRREISDLVWDWPVVEDRFNEIIEEHRDDPIVRNWYLRLRKVLRDIGAATRRRKLR